MENRKRNIQMKFYVTEEEKRLIDEKMKQLPRAIVFWVTSSCKVSTPFPVKCG